MLIEIGPNLTIAIQTIIAFCGIISFLFLLYLLRKG